MNVAHGKKQILVAGATGYLGRYLVKNASSRGYRVRALVRSEARLGDARPFCDEIFVGEATEPETLEGLCDGMDFVVSSLGNRSFARSPDCYDVDFRGNMNILARAHEASVSQSVFISVLGGEEFRSQVPQFEARERVVDALRAGAMAWTVIRPSGFFNDMMEIFNMAKRGRVWITGGGGRFNPIHGADLAEVCLDAVGNVDAYDQEILAGGPDCLTMLDVSDLAHETLVKTSRVSTIPRWVLKATGTAIRPFNVNLASMILMMSLLAEGDWCCDAYGTHRLRDFFQAAADRNGRDIAARA